MSYRDTAMPTLPRTHFVKSLLFDDIATLYKVYVFMYDNRFTFNGQKERSFGRWRPDTEAIVHYK